MIVEKAWIVSEPDPETVIRISQGLGISVPMAKCLVARGFRSAAEANHFIHADVDLLENPFQLRDMEKAVERLKEAKRRGEPVHVAGDRDADGVTSTALLVNLLRQEGFRHTWKVPTEADGYGLSRPAVDAAAAAGAKLILAVDCGIVDFDGVLYAREKKIEVVILDHHEPADELPLANAVVDPKRKDCPYAFDGLSACGVAFKFAQAYLMTEDDSFYGKEIVFFDLETTGISPKTGEIVEIGAMKTRNGVVIDSFETLIKPVSPIPASYTELHGISNEMVAGAPGVAEALRKFLAFAGDAALAAHNAPFDLKFTRYYAKKELDLEIANEMIDTAAMARTLLPGGDSSLAGLCARYGIVNEAAHRALSDVRSTFAVWRRLVSRNNPKMQAFLKSQLDLVALSTLADVVPLVEENRVLVKRGLDAFRRSERPGIVALRDALVRGAVSAKDVAWSVTPVLNAAGRLGKAYRAVELLLAEDFPAARLIVAELVAMNTERKERAKLNMEMTLDALPEVFNPDTDVVAVVAVRGMERGVTGIVANRILHMIGRPVVVLIEDDGEVAHGTARSIEDFDIRGAFARLSQYCHKFGGHQFACAVSVHRARIAEFRRDLNDLIRREVPPERLRPRIAIDAEVDVEDVSDALLKEIDLIEPTGQGNEAPLFCVRNAEVHDARRMGDRQQHIKISLRSNLGKPLEMVAWNVSAVALPDPGHRVDVAFAIERNEWRGRAALQCLIEDFRIRT